MILLDRGKTFIFLLCLYEKKKYHTANDDKTSVEQRSYFFVINRSFALRSVQPNMYNKYITHLETAVAYLPLFLSQSLSLSRAHVLSLPDVLFFVSYKNVVYRIQV